MENKHVMSVSETAILVLSLSTNFLFDDEHKSANLVTQRLFKPTYCTVLFS